jgi:hypothetical protein
MREVKLSTKNQIVIPREIRDALGVKGGRQAASCSAGGHRDFVAQAEKVLQGHCWYGQGTFRPWLSR